MEKEIGLRKVVFMKRPGWKLGDTAGLRCVVCQPNIPQPAFIGTCDDIPEAQAFLTDGGDDGLRHGDEEVTADTVGLFRGLRIGGFVRTRERSSISSARC